MMILPSLMLAVAVAATPDPLSAAHDRKDSSHVMKLMFVSSAMEMMNKNELHVFGRRREIACPTGAVIVDASCDPCTEKLDTAPERPMSNWIYEISWASTAEKAKAIGELEHFSKYFKLTLAGGSDRGARTYQDYRFDGPRQVVTAPSTAAAVEIWVAGRPATQATIPEGQVEVEVEARAFRKTEAGGMEPMPDAKFDWNTPCGTVRALPNPHLAFFSLKPGIEKCVLKLFASPGQAMAAVNVTRELTVGIVFQGAEPDEVVLEGELTAEFTYRASASGRPIEIDAEWGAVGGKVESMDGPKKIRFRLDVGAPQGELILTDRTSGASDRVVIRRSH